MNVIEHDSQSPRLLIDGGKKYPSVVPVLPTALHDHPFAEVHIITQGYALYTVDGITHTVSQAHDFYLTSLTKKDISTEFYGNNPPYY